MINTANEKIKMLYGRLLCVIFHSEQQYKFIKCEDNINGDGEKRMPDNPYGTIMVLLVVLMPLVSPIIVVE